MSKVIIKVDEGCESIYEVAINELSKIDSDINVEKEEAFALIEKKYQDKKERLTHVINTVSHEEIIEEEIADIPSENATIEETIIEEAPVEE